MDSTFHQFRVESPQNPAPFNEPTQSTVGGASLVAIHFETGSNTRKGPYGSGDADEYSLTCESMTEFDAWRLREEEEKVVEFVRSDRHTSKSVPPRFKEHTKLVCARHSKPGHNRYKKKFPERNRKTPSRKLEGQGCPASISFKTYFDSDQIRACYRSEHSHETGLANLPFTRRGRKALAEDNKPRSESRRPSGSVTAGNQGAASHDSSSQIDDSLMLDELEDDLDSVVASPSTVDPTNSMFHSVTEANGVQSHTQLCTSTSISQIAPLPQMDLSPHISEDHSQDRWNRMAVLFDSVRNHSRSFSYPQPSVAALEAVLIRLYLESPLGGPPPNPNPTNNNV